MSYHKSLKGFETKTLGDEVVLHFKFNILDSRADAPTAHFDSGLKMLEQYFVTEILYHIYS